MSKFKKGLLKYIRVGVTFGFCFVLITFIGFCLSVFVVSFHDPEDGRDAIIVLGAGLRGDAVSLTLAERLGKAIWYYEKNPEVMIVVSGGQGEDELVSEASAMRKYLVLHGVNADNVLLEDNSTNTAENFSLSKEVLDGYFQGAAYTTAYVTNGFHCFRAGKYAEKAGFDADFIPARTPILMAPAYCARDYLGAAYITVVGT